ncbi:CotH kinase family protein [Alkalihalobacillus sp. TS-13]|uniref:CotH kinase family protein n=1 Tax=Alkalihalobacillus sp. TS-13 TaxID=2842455 RepID=UPI001C87F5FD|nr:CotH kinase family protein [Alkalihalobacillus sp. TS-13]
MSSNRDIPSYEIHINEDVYKRFKKDVWSEDPVDAVLVVGDNKYEIQLLYRGAHIRKVTKKSYQFIFPKVTSGIKELHLNAEYIDKSLIRNKLSLDFFESISVLSPKSNHVLLTINGEFQGIYLQLESVDRYLLKNRNLPKGPIFYAENDNANFSLMSPIRKGIKKRFESGYSLKEGTKEDTAALGNFVYKINTISQKEFETEIHHYLDVDKYLRWLAGVVCTQNFDGFIHNYALYRRSDTGLFEILPWDYDATFGRDIHGKEMEYDYIPVQGYNTLTARLLDVSSFKNQYYHILKKILENQFTPEYLEKEIQQMYRQIEPYVIKDPHLKETIKQFYNEPEFILKYITNRNKYLRAHLSDLL